MIVRDGNSRRDPDDNKNLRDFFLPPSFFINYGDSGMEFYQYEIIRIPGDNRVKGKRIIKMTLG